MSTLFPPDTSVADSLSRPPGAIADVLNALLARYRDQRHGAAPSDMLRTALSALRPLLGFDRAVALLWDPDRESYLAVAASGIDEEAFSTLRSLAFTATTFAGALPSSRSNEAVRVNDDSTGGAVPRDLARVLGPHPMLLAPLRDRRAVPRALLLFHFDRDDGVPSALAFAHAALTGAVSAQIELMLEIGMLDEALSRRGRRLEMLTELSLSLSTDLGHDPLSLLVRLRQRVPELAGTAAEIILLADEVEPTYDLWCLVEGKPLDAAHGLPMAPSVLTAAARGGRPIVVRDPVEIAHLGGFPPAIAAAVPDAASAVTLPLLVRHRAIGALVFISRDRNAYDPEQVTFFGAVAAQLAVTIDHSRLYSLLRSRGDVRRRLLDQTLHAQELERKSLVDGILDDALQELASCAYRLNLCSRLSERGEHERSRAELGATRQQLSERIESLRGLVAALRPSSLDHLGLAAVLRDELAAFGQATGLFTDFRDGLRRRLPSAIETRAFRIVQELLNNVRRHAGATRVSIELAQRESEVVVSVIDDGSGFLVEEVLKDSTTIGLHAVREQAELEGGVVRLQSWPGAGTCVEVAFPHVAMRQQDASS